MFATARMQGFVFRAVFHTCRVSCPKFFCAGFYFLKLFKEFLVCYYSYCTVQCVYFQGFLLTTDAPGEFEIISDGIQIIPCTGG
jgi:hypothetical protein